MIKNLSFTVKQEHLDLLKHMYVDFDDTTSHSIDYIPGAPVIDTKRPYGNKNAALDIARILGWNVKYVENADDSHWKLTKTQLAKAEKLHRETATALQICLVTQKFKTGKFKKRDIFVDTSWEEIK